MKGSDMSETAEQRQQRMAGYMTAVMHLLGGETVRHRAFNERVELIVGGSAANLPTLLHWGERVRRSGRPIMLFSPTGVPTVPLISLVAQVGKRTHTIESCMLWMGEHDDRARLVPDNFGMGAFVLGHSLRIRHAAASPARDFDDAMPGMERAYRRLVELEQAARNRGDAPLPSLLKAA